MLRRAALLLLFTCSLGVVMVATVRMIARFNPTLTSGDLFVLYAGAVTITVTPVVAFGFVHFHFGRQDRRRSLGQCERCGYDLRQTTGRCPECGAWPVKDQA